MGETSTPGFASESALAVPRNRPRGKPGTVWASLRREPHFRHRLRPVVLDVADVAADLPHVDRARRGASSSRPTALGPAHQVIELHVLVTPMLTRGHVDPDRYRTP